MGTKVTKKTGTPKVPDHAKLPGFEQFKGREIATIDDLAYLMEEFGIYRIYIRSPNSRSMTRDIAEAEDGTWQVGVKLNTFIVDYRRSDGCKTLHEAMEQALGLKVVSPELKSKTLSADSQKPESEPDEELLV
ncbi:hypothetical protein RCCWILLIS_60 [Rhodobacter phage RcCWillis]|nr:hypothetical protein RCCWILLIS_60 [Rhodobacter phage RcCWillis]